MTVTATERRRVTKAFGACLRRLRDAAGMSQEVLAAEAEAEINRTYPSLLERGLRAPTLPIIFAIARVLKVTPAQLVRMVHDEANV